MKTKIKNQCRQGDVLIERIESIPDGAALPDKHGPSILAHGEVTGHAHTVARGRLSSFSPVTALNAPLDIAYLSIPSAANVTHQEHAPVPVKRGAALVIRQREYSPTAIRNVAD